MQKAVALLVCAALGCTTTSYRWTPTTAGANPMGRQVFLVTADRAVVVEDAERSGGRVGGHVVQMWQVPPGTQVLPDGESPAEIARRGGWVELPAPSFFAAEATAMQRILVGETTAEGYTAVAVVCAFYVAGALAYALFQASPRAY